MIDLGVSIPVVEVDVWRGKEVVKEDEVLLADEMVDCPSIVRGVEVKEFFL